MILENGVSGSVEYIGGSAYEYVSDLMQVIVVAKKKRSKVKSLGSEPKKYMYV